MRVLFVCTQSPAPAHGGAALRIRGWLEVTTDFAEVGLVVFTRSPDEDEAIRRLADERRWWLETTLSPRTVAARLLDRSNSLVTRRPHLLVAAQDRRFLAAVRRGLREFRPDVVQAEQIAAAPCLAMARDAGVATVYSAHNVESRVLAGPTGSSAAGRSTLRRLAVERMRRIEQAEAAAAAAVVVVSPEEKTWFERRARRVAWVPNAVELDHYRFLPPSRRTDPHILFTGHMGYPPNQDAAMLLAREVYPRVTRRIPEVRCRIAGARPGRSVRRLADRGVEVTADFDRFEDLARRSGIFVCPLRWGAGSRLKLLEAAAVGLPIVATRFSAEGLRLEPGRDFLAASEPAAIAEAIVDLLRDEGRRETLAQSARATVEKHHAWAGQRERIVSLYESLLGDAGQG